MALGQLIRQKSGKKWSQCFTSFRSFVSNELSAAWRKLFSMMLVRNSKLLAALGATRSQYSATVLCCHSLTETVLVHSAAIVRLKCSFHCVYMLFMLLFALVSSAFGVQKYLFIFKQPKGKLFLVEKSAVFLLFLCTFAPHFGAHAGSRSSCSGSGQGTIGLIISNTL